MVIKVRIVFTFGGAVTGKEHEGGFRVMVNILYLGLKGVNSLNDNLLLGPLMMCALSHMYILV